MGDEIVDRLVDGFSFGQLSKVLGEQIVVEGVGMIPVEMSSFFEGKVSEIAVVCVHVDERDGESVERVGDVFCDG